ncbi:hypothetical protein [Nonomuraea sp. LPB2021202275-12-8]|uniref:hypothetical protein n=1 Tax=Nonomuraea sp. LPB2021202275-12-8 TaxID=3120159 RepID=UPI00300CE97E
MQATRRRSRTIWTRALAGLVALLIAGTLGVVVAYPSVAATTCPGCYGLTELHPGVYTEQGLSDEQRAHVTRVVETARRRVSDFYGGQAGSPALLICLTEDCYQRIGGGKERGIAVLNRAVMLSPRGLDPVIASHELSHVELHERLGGGSDIPQWFDEGLAVAVSNDPRYLAPESAPDRCLTEPSEPLPVTLEDWLRAAGQDPATYAKSACQVSRWLDQNGDRAGLRTLIHRLNNGEPFTTMVKIPRQPR